MSVFAIARPRLRRVEGNPLQRTIGIMTKLSVNLPTKLVRDLKRAASGDVDAFVAEAVRNELAYRHLGMLEQELVDRVGPVDEARVAEIGALFAKVDNASATMDPEEGEDS